MTGTSFDGGLIQTALARNRDSWLQLAYLHAPPATPARSLRSLRPHAQAAAGGGLYLPHRLRSARGQKVLTLRGAMPRDPDFKQELCANMQGFRLLAAVRCGADDCNSLEQLCRHITRPALTNERAVPRDRACGATLKIPWHDGHHAPGAVALGVHAAAGCAGERQLCRTESHDL